MVYLADLEGGFPRQHEEELLRTLMEVPNLTGTGRHMLLDYAQISGLQEMPTIALRTPQVMLGITQLSYRKPYPVYTSGRFSKFE